MWCARCCAVSACWDPAAANECRRRHEIVLRFLIRLGLDAETAERDAEGIEHHVSQRTLALFEAYADQV